MSSLETDDKKRLRELARSDDKDVRVEAQLELARREREENRETYEKLARE
ncbi:hypothetical protein [Halegenticoccus soli]|nr:hypothetical protein [Halegenticoccus soli]